MIFGGKVGHGGDDDGLNVGSHLCFQICSSYSATVIRCLRKGIGEYNVDFSFVF